MLKKHYRKLITPLIAFGIIYLFILTTPDRSQTAEDGLIQQIPTNEDQQLNSLEITVEQQDIDVIEDVIIVDVKGMVKYPGVYSLSAGERVIDAIELAGGYLPESDSTSINHAQKVSDEMIIYVPYKGEENLPFSYESPSQKDDGKVNINTADVGKLTTLPGVGPSKAQAIISYREDVGLFSAAEELKNVTGIGEKTFERLQDLITVK